MALWDEMHEADLHPHDPVVRTFSLAFQKVEEESPAAADLLRLCAFFAPDDIPEEIVTAGAPDLGEALGAAAARPLDFVKARGAATRYSLLFRDPDRQALSLHRVVQAVLKAGMDEATRRLWAERAVRAINHVFPEVEFSSWPLCDRLLLHARECARLAGEMDMAFPEVRRLLNLVAYYLYERAQYAEAEPLYQRALAIREQALGPQHPQVATSLNNLALLYHSQGKYTEAEPLYQRALAIWEQALGLEHPRVAIVLGNYARLLSETNRAAEAEAMRERARAIRDEHARRNPV